MMKRFLFLPLLFSIGAFGAPAGGANSPAGELEPFAVQPEEDAHPHWSSDYAAALSRAGREKRCVLLSFTGSDWCIWCQRLDAQVLEQKAFIDYAGKQLVLVEIDFPHSKPQSAELERQNQELSKKFGVTGYPTVIVVSAEGRELGRTGYMHGGAKTFVRELKRFTAKAPP